MGKTYRRIKAECDKLGLSVGALCRRADIDRSILSFWKKSEPKTLQILAALKLELRKEAEKQKQAQDAYDKPEEDILFTGS
jgi:hypothetical protein